MGQVINARNLSKSFGATIALKNATFCVGQNEIFGLIGADGAGKTTLMKILATLLLADGGECAILGRDCVRDFSAIRPHLGYMPATFSLYGDLSVEENLRFFANIFGVSLEENYALIAPIFRALEPFKNRRSNALSGGMKQKLALCCALIHKPKILLLDEPSTGVDAVSRAEFWEILRDLKRQMSIIVSTPYMDEAELCDKIALMASGEILRIGTPREIIADFHTPLFALKNLPIALLPKLRALSAIKSAFLFGDAIHITLKDSRESPLQGKIIQRDLGELDLNRSYIERSEISKNLGESKKFNELTPPPAPPLKKGRGELFFSLGFHPLTFLQGKKVSKKDLDLGDSRNSSESTKTHYGDFNGQSPLNPQNHDSRESKRFLPTFSKSRWGLGQRPAQLNFSPSPCGRGLGGGVKNLKDSHESHESQEIFRLIPQNDKKIIDSRKLSESLCKSLQTYLRQKLDCESLEIAKIAPNIEDCFMEFANAK